MKRGSNFKWVLFCCLIVVLFAGQAYAKGPQGVSYGLHNLSATGADPSAPGTPECTALDVILGVPGCSAVTPAGPDGQAETSQYRTDEDQICVFCHTPHGGSLSGPLWNRSNPSASSFTHYNSASASSYLRGLSVTRLIEDESLLCMSCHDGSIAVNKVLNLPNDRNGAAIATGDTLLGSSTDTEIISTAGLPGPRIGASASTPDGPGDLTDDHPISFSYNLVLASGEYSTGGSKAGELHSVEDAEDNGNGVRFFQGGITPGGNRVECSSCHDPHVNYNENLGGGNADYAPFLIMPNNGSAMCLACHNK